MFYQVLNFELISINPRLNKDFPCNLIIKIFIKNKTVAGDETLESSANREPRPNLQRFGLKREKRESPQRSFPAIYQFIWTRNKTYGPLPDMGFNKKFRHRHSRDARVKRQRCRRRIRGFSNLRLHLARILQREKSAALLPPFLPIRVLQSRTH